MYSIFDKYSNIFDIFHNSKACIEVMQAGYCLNKLNEFCNYLVRTNVALSAEFFLPEQESSITAE